MSCRSVVALLVVSGIGWSFYSNRRLIEGRVYEITHRYQGVLDCVIPYIQDRDEHTERLVIATNYEETSYIYYLGCRVVVGFLTPDLAHDLLEKPNYIIYRGFWSVLTDSSVFDNLLRRASYKTVRFPVYDYGVNNIPETVHWSNLWGWKQLGHVPPAAFRFEDCIPIWGGVQLQHFFGTVTTDIPQNQATLYLLKDDAANKPSARGGVR